MEKIFNWVSIIFGVVGGFIAGALGGWDKWLIALVIFVIFDYITGVIKAIYKKQLSSEIGFKGILKKGTDFRRCCGRCSIAGAYQ